MALVVQTQTPTKPKRISDVMMKKIARADTEAAEQAALEELITICGQTFGLAAKILTEIRRKKFSKPEDMDEPEAHAVIISTQLWSYDPSMHIYTTHNLWHARFCTH